ncbi:MAG: VTT domain-containing protein [Caldilineaceae bacterium]|nr:VTT domain-containing protein [Caldilineaceae bacterium]
MSLADLSGEILTYIITYGSVALGVTVLLAALGVPFPSTLFVLASGAFVQQGVLDLPSTLAVALLFVVTGDSLSYGMGRLLRRVIQRRFGRLESWRNAEAYFQQRGGIAIYLTRCLLTPIAVPTNWIAGSSGYRPLRFIGYAAAGELTWLLAYGGLGYLFGSQWEVVSAFVSDFSGLLVGLVMVGGGVYWWLRREK